MPRRTLAAFLIGNYLMWADAHITEVAETLEFPEFELIEVSNVYSLSVSKLFIYFSIIFSYSVPYRSISSSLFVLCCINFLSVIMMYFCCTRNNLLPFFLVFSLANKSYYRCWNTIVNSNSVFVVFHRLVAAHSSSTASVHIV